MKNLVHLLLTAPYSFNFVVYHKKNEGDEGRVLTYANDLKPIP